MNENKENDENDENIEFYKTLINISKSYRTINEMAQKSLDMKKNNDDINAINLLDCAIALQLRIKFKDNEDLRESSKQIFQETLTKLLENNETSNVH